MKNIIQKSRYMVLAGVVPLLLVSIAAFIWGILKSYYVVREIVVTTGQSDHIAVSLISVMDAYLIAIGLFIFAVNLYELFIDKLNMPPWMLSCNLHELKTKITNMIILVMAVKFMEHLVEWNEPLNTMYLGVAITLVSGALIAFDHFGQAD